MRKQNTTRRHHTPALDDDPDQGRVRQAAAHPVPPRQVGHDERRELSTLVECIPDAVVVVDASANPLVANTAYGQFLVVTGSAHTCLDHRGRPVAPEAMPLQRAARAQAADLELSWVNPAGERLPYQVTVRPARIRGAPRAVGVVTFRDVGERQRRLLQERFLSLVAHELRAPLSGILAYAELQQSCLEDGIPGPELETAAQRIAHLAARLNEMVEDLVDVARISTGQFRVQFRRIDLRAVVESAVELARSRPQAPAICVDAPARAMMLDGDAGRLSEVVLNLLSNAITHAAGTPRIDVRLRGDRRGLALDVEDYGPGISPDSLPLIFEQHFRVLRADDGVASKGLGLGLFIARQIVTAHRGRIDVESTLGAGTRFTVRLPRRQQASAPADGRQTA